MGRPFCWGVEIPPSASTHWAGLFISSSPECEAWHWSEGKAGKEWLCSSVGYRRDSRTFKGFSGHSQDLWLCFSQSSHGVTSPCFHLNSTHPQGSAQTPPPPVLLEHLLLTSLTYSPLEWAPDCLKFHIHWAMHIYFNLPSLFHLAPTGFSGITAQRARSAWALHLHWGAQSKWVWPASTPQWDNLCSRMPVNQAKA